MSKVKTYLKVAKTNRGYKVSASSKPSNKPMSDNASNNTTYYPTVSFGIVLNIPDEMFAQAEKIIAQIDVDKKDVVINTEVESL